MHIRYILRAIIPAALSAIRSFPPYGVWKRRSAKAAKAAGISLKTALMISLEKARSCGNAGIWRKRWLKGMEPSLLKGRAASGKERFAPAIHNASFRHESPFIAFNCASIPDTLIESELCGYEEGAFLPEPVRAGSPGFLNWPTEGLSFRTSFGMSHPICQTKLLRVLQEKEIVRVGGQEVIPVDIRIISASNKNIPGLVREHTFRIGSLLSAQRAFFENSGIARTWGRYPLAPASFFAGIRIAVSSCQGGRRCFAGV